MSVFVSLNTSKQVGDPGHLKDFANADTAEARFENDPEGVGSGMKGRRLLVARNRSFSRREVNEYGIRYIRSDALGMDFGWRALMRCSLCRRAPGTSLLVFPRPWEGQRCRSWKALSQSVLPPTGGL